MNAELATYNSITVSLDGALFEDGTFAGPDRSGFYGAVKAEVDSRYDLLQQLKADLLAGKKIDEVFAPVEGAAAAAAVDLGPGSTEADYYAYFRKLYAEEILEYGKSLGREGALHHVLKQLDKPWKKPRKV